jgi:hypothetical protein
MTYKQAIKIMKKGGKVRHKELSGNNEFLQIVDGQLQDEYGYHVNLGFLSLDKRDWFNGDYWEVYEPKKSN